MKTNFFVLIAIVLLLAGFRISDQAEHSAQPGILTVVSSNPNQEVSFAVAMVSGDSLKSSPLNYGKKKTPFYVKITSRCFFGIFQKVSGKADIIVEAKTYPASQSDSVVIRKTFTATSRVVLIVKLGDQLTGEEF